MRRSNQNPQADVDAWNQQHPVGTRVRYWTGRRAGDPSGESVTHSPAWNLCGSAVVGIKGVAGGIALTHVEVIPEGTPARPTVTSVDVLGDGRLLVFVGAEGFGSSVLCANREAAERTFGADVIARYVPMDDDDIAF